MSKSRQSGRKPSKRPPRGDLAGRAKRREKIVSRRDKLRKKPSWFQGKRPILRFVLLFGACMGVFYAAASTTLYFADVLTPYLEINAEVSGAILRLFGQDATVSGQSISSPRAALSIQRGCDAIHPSALFLAAVLVFPASLWKKSVGAVAGVALLLAINLVRIISLFYIRIHFPAAFEIMHVEVWQALFIFLALLCWIVWVAWATRAGEGRTDASV